MSDSFSVSRNVEEDYSISIPSGYVENPKTNFVRIIDEVTLSAIIDLNVFPEPILALSSPDIVGVPTTVSVGPTVKVYPAFEAEADIAQGRTDSFSIGGAAGIWIGTETTGGRVTGNYVNWIPFDATDLTQGQTIVSAVLELHAQNSSSNSVSIKFNCERAINVIRPVSYNDTVTRAATLTAGVTVDDNVPAWVAGTGYTYDVTTAVQEVLNLPSWGSVNKTIAVIISHGNLATTGYRFAVSYMGGANKAVLTVTY
jgi:hypothetical protein